MQISPNQEPWASAEKSRKRALLRVALFWLAFAAFVAIAFFNLGCVSQSWQHIEPNLTVERVPLDQYIAAARARSDAPKVSGFSMSPYVQTMDLTVVEPITAQTQFSPGDMILFNYMHDHKQVLVFHMVREVSKDGSSVYTEGKHNPFPDGWQRREQIVGRVRRVLRAEFAVSGNH